MYFMETEKSMPLFTMLAAPVNQNIIILTDPFPGCEYILLNVCVCVRARSA